MKIRQIGGSLLVIAAMAVLVSACGGGGGEQPTGTSLTLIGEDIKFEPTTLSARAGEPVTVTLNNNGALEHNFSLDEAGATVTVQSGQSGNTTFTAPAAGTYEFYCSVAGHKEAGMVGTFTVTP